MGFGELEEQASASQSPRRRRIWLAGHILSLLEEGNSPSPRGISHCPCLDASSFLISPQVWYFVSRQTSVVELTGAIAKSLLIIVLSERRHVPGNTHSPAENGKSKPSNSPGMSVHWSRDQFIAALEERVFPHQWRGTRKKDIRNG